MPISGIYIQAHQGLGDHILCMGIYREYAKIYSKCVLGVIPSNHEAVKAMLADVKNIQIELYSSSTWAQKADLHANALNFSGYDILRLGQNGSGFFEDNQMRLDENYYQQAGLPLSLRWDSFSLRRNLDRENELFNRLCPSNEPYIFLHEDSSRGFKINRELIPKDVKIIEPDLSLISEFNFIDYLKVIENSSEMHCIESSFCALIESMQYDTPKFAHRYARPEAKADYRHEFTYRSNWEILL